MTLQHTGKGSGSESLPHCSSQDDEPEPSFQTRHCGGNQCRSAGEYGIQPAVAAANTRIRRENLPEPHSCGNGVTKQERSDSEPAEYDRLSVPCSDRQTALPAVVPKNERRT